MTKKIVTKLDSRAVFLFLSSCHLASVAFGGDKSMFDMESALSAVKRNPQMNEGKSRELEQSHPMYEPEHIKRFRESIFDICTKYLDSRKKDDVIEVWNAFFSLLERNKLSEKNVHLKDAEIEKILNELPEEREYEQDSKNRLIGWHANYTKNNALGPNLSLSSRAIKRRDSATQLRPSL